MLRDKTLIPLSHQHQHALALCVRIERAAHAGELDLNAWQAEIEQLYQQEIAIHFAAEETVLFPAAVRFSKTRSLVDELLAEHAVLREFFARAVARKLTSEDLRSLAQTLSAHIRKEERQLFEAMQSLLSSDELAAIGAELDKALAGASDSCILPSEATRLRPKQ